MPIVDFMHMIYLYSIGIYFEICTLLIRGQLIKLDVFCLESVKEWRDKKIIFYKTLSNTSLSFCMFIS